jgi:hypothetical protein
MDTVNLKALGVSRRKRGAALSIRIGSLAASPVARWRSSNASDMQRVPIPQFHAKVHIRDVVQVRILKLAQQFVHALISGSNLAR